MRSSWGSLACLLIALVLAAPARCEQPRRWLPFPTDRLFPTAIADPTTTGFGLSQLRVTQIGVEDSGETRFELRLGGQFGLVRWQPWGETGWAFQLGIEAGFNGQFDVDRSYDNIGWDGLYGLTASAAGPGGLAFKLGAMHTSSHVGDEYAERTGRRRIGYTREELVLGVSWPTTCALRVYAELAHGYELRNRELQQPGRAQAGIELEQPGVLLGGRLGWYAALDANAWEERDWEVDLSAQVGFLYPAGDRRWRAGISYHDGRVPIGEFFQDSETYWSFGLWLDV